MVASTPCCGAAPYGSLEILGFDGADAATIRVVLTCSACQLFWSRGVSIAVGFHGDQKPRTQLVEEQQSLQRRLVEIDGLLEKIPEES